LKKIKVVSYLEPEMVKSIDEIADMLTKERAECDLKNKVPPSKRGRKVTRSKALGKIIEAGIQWFPQS
jgi:hypothetical protein